MTIADDYINRVISNMPVATPRRAQIAQELQGHIAERTERGQPIDDVLRQLGDPVKLAESYLAAVPLVPVSFWRRAAAKIVDALLLTGVAVVIAAAIGLALRAELFPMLLFLCIGVLAFVALTLAAYTAFTEWRYGKTIGKHLMGLRVVRESGARISFGQAVVRQLPQWLQVFWIDALFAFFTERHQRAFELLSKTRVVAA
jgi:uncharacterized RDD family membrane protein YckC